MTEGANSAPPETSPLYFFPDRQVTERELRETLRSGSPEQRAEMISALLRYAEWEHIWQFVSREDVCEIFPQLDLPSRLRQAWARVLKIEAPVV